MFDKEWIESLIELQKKSRELSKEIPWPKEYLDRVFEAIQNSVKNPVSFEVPDYSDGFKTLWNVGVESFYEDIYEPKINLTETANGILIKAAIPGIKDKRDICVKVKGSNVNISGKISDNYNNDKKGVLSFNKNIPLPAEVDPQKTTAKYNDGILTLYLPKITEVHPQQIEITFL